MGNQQTRQSKLDMALNWAAPDAACFDTLDTCGTIQDDLTTANYIARSWDLLKDSVPCDAGPSKEYDVEDNAAIFQQGQTANDPIYVSDKESMHSDEGPSVRTNTTEPDPRQPSYLGLATSTCSGSTTNREDRIDLGTRRLSQSADGREGYQGSEDEDSEVDLQWDLEGRRQDETNE
jgi:hypothetical protein